jgi:hypothetical protein
MVNDNGYVGDTASDNTSTTQAEAPVSYVVGTPTPPIDNDGSGAPSRTAPDAYNGTTYSLSADQSTILPVGRSPLHDQAIRRASRSVAAMAVLNLDQTNTEDIGTTLKSTGTEPRAIAFEVDNPNGGAITGVSSIGVGVAGDSDRSIGTFGYSHMDVGIFGYSHGATGVFGQGENTGVAGMSSHIGVTGNGDIGVGGYGRIGVIGKSTGENGCGVWGQTYGESEWPGVEGYSMTGNGVRGVSLGSIPGPNNGVVGYSESGVGVVGITNSRSGLGGVFIGGLVVQGGPKSAAVPHPDGSHRLLYSMESPESWFEDFGRAKLDRGKAKVTLDPSFAAVVRTDDYHVFLSPEGENGGLYVSRRGRAGFEVRETQRGTSSLTFSFRVVARRKDIEAPRFQSIQLPNFEHDDMVNIPTAIAEQQPPKVPDLPKRSGRLPVSK